ncbi:MAG: ribonuclease Z [Bacteroidales bacterium]|nr:ribonuclease Z [Bacteroidales bacterium]
MEDNALIVLGCSSATPNSVRFPSAQILHFRSKYFLIDCGEGTQMQLRRAKVPFERIDSIFISHLHGDHYFGLFGLLASLNLTGRKNPLTVYAPEGLEELVRYHFLKTEQPFSYPLQFVALPQEPCACIKKGRGYEIRAIQLNHRVPCWGFYFVEEPKERKIQKEAIDRYDLSIEEVKCIKNGSDLTLQDGTVIPNAELTIDPVPAFSYAYISDTMLKPDIAQYVQGARLLYHEATFLHDLLPLANTTHHSTARQAGEFAQMVHAEKLIIGHFSARYKDLNGHLTEAKDVFENVELASDLNLYTLYKPAYSIWN